MNKYRNIKVEIGGMKFDSKTEYMFYMQLLATKQQKDEISSIECQPIIKFPDGTKMIPDFKVEFRCQGTIYYDVKSPATRLNKTYRLKKRLLHYFFKDIQFVEVLRDKTGWKFL
jgi:hypothetical protein